MYFQYDAHMFSSHSRYFHEKRRNPSLSLPFAIHQKKVLGLQSKLAFSIIKMSLLNRSTKLAGPMGAIALTSASATLFGRQTTQNATSKVSAHATRHMHVFVQNHLAQVRREACKQHKYFFSTSSNSANGGFVKWYEGHLSSSPVATKAVTGSILWGLGDLVAQLVPTLIQEEQTNSDDEQQLKPFQYDYPRTARAVFFGFALHAPLSHLHFNFLEWMTVRTGFTGLGASVFKTVMEQVRTKILPYR
jgi:hypothetical protein